MADPRISPPATSGDIVAFLKNTETQGRLVSDSKKIGGGSYGEVYSAVWSKQTDRVAVKLSHTMSLIHELNIMALLTVSDAPNTIKLLGYFESRGYLPGEILYSIIMPLASRALNKALADDSNRLSLEKCHNILLGVSRAVAHMHLRNMIHRDIKPENILLDANDEPLLADFGESIYDGNRAERSDVAGTLAYFAPELLKGGGVRVYTPETDVFAFALTAWETIERPKRTPQLHAFDLYFFYSEGKRLDISPDATICPPKFAKIMRLGWMGNPELRIKAHEIVTELERKSEGSGDDKVAMTSITPQGTCALM